MIGKPQSSRVISSGSTSAHRRGHRRRWGRPGAGTSRSWRSPWRDRQHAGGRVPRHHPRAWRPISAAKTSSALRFAPRGTQVMISADIAGPSLVIEVRDSGPGFPPDFLPHAFERFRRPGQDRARSAGGAGLGLAIVQAIALAHEGRVVASNDPEGGAVVRLEVPHR